ncbi:hypothetical protein COLO4_10069 [Corchorus olitorius]|uniref:Uncharacterized protein n=1 Tax=Corchorus olitorius TaxID=93759 RepID=A0A1R3KA56_9ROSI|nr:hypothetical protein COLO4_10069 [Corchorus olitorius]
MRYVIRMYRPMVDRGWKELFAETPTKPEMAAKETETPSNQLHVNARIKLMLPMAVAIVYSLHPFGCMTALQLSRKLWFMKLESIL